MDRAVSLTVSLPNHAGELATVSEMLGQAGINIEGICCVEYDDRSTCNFLFPADAQVAARRVFEGLGHKVQMLQEVIVVEIENRPGLLGAYTRRIAEAGVNLTVAYTAMGSRLVLGAGDIDALVAAWEGIRALATDPA